MQEQQLWNVRYIRMCLSSFFQYLTHYTLIAALPIYVVQTLNQSENQAGLTLTFFQIGAVLFRPFAGKWMDDYDKKRVIFASLALFCVVCFLYLGVQTIFFLFVLRFFHGVGFSTGTTATATMVAIFSPASRMGEGVGNLAVFTSIAMVIGPFIGLKLIAEYSTAHLFGACALFGLLAFLCGNMKLMPQQNIVNSTRTTAAFCWTDLFEQNALPIAFCGGLLAFVYSSLLGFLPLYAQSIGMMGMASYFFAVYALVIIITRPFIGKVFDRMGAKCVVYASIFFYLVGMVGLSQVKSSTELLLAGALIGLGFGGLNPSFQTLAVQAAPTHKKGLATSTYFLSLDIGIGVGSFVLGVVVNFTNYRTMYLVCAVITAFIALSFYGINSKSRR